MRFYRKIISSFTVYLIEVKYKVHDVCFQLMMSLSVLNLADPLWLHLRNVELRLALNLRIKRWRTKGDIERRLELLNSLCRVWPFCFLNTKYFLILFFIILNELTWNVLVFPPAPGKWKVCRGCNIPNSSSPNWRAEGSCVGCCFLLPPCCLLYHWASYFSWWRNDCKWFLPNSWLNCEFIAELFLSYPTCWCKRMVFITIMDHEMNLKRKRRKIGFFYYYLLLSVWKIEDCPPQGHL